MRRSTTESDPQFFHLMLFSDDNKAQKVLIWCFTFWGNFVAAGRSEVHRRVELEWSGPDPSEAEWLPELGRPWWWGPSATMPH